MSSVEKPRYYVEIENTPADYFKWELSIHDRERRVDLYHTNRLNTIRYTWNWPSSWINYRAKRLIRKQTRIDKRASNGQGKWVVE